MPDIEDVSCCHLSQGVVVEVQALEALRDSIISISVILMRSLGKLLLFECAFKLIVTDLSGIEIQSIRHQLS